MPDTGHREGSGTGLGAAALPGDDVGLLEGLTTTRTTGWNFAVDTELRALLGVPDGTAIAGTITLGKPAGRHGPVRRRPLAELVFAERWGQAPDWAVDPPGTAFTSAGPPRA
jgi:hypothetical protein